ncbi:MAG: restriction endonuclease subunit S [Desulfobacula sp.]|nr:restriction endonuclease subunit S [Desulfobacula sp.]
MSKEFDDLSEIVFENKRWDIPKTWIWTTINSVGNIITGNTTPKKNENNYGNDIPFIKPPSLLDRGVYSSPEGLSKKGMRLARILPPDSVLVSCIGNLGKTGITSATVAFNQQINAIIFSDSVVSKYGFYYAQTLKNWLYRVASATTLPIVNKGKFQNAPIPLAPFNEQKRIVAEIDKQFSRLDEAVDNLKRIKANLKRYKGAVLKAAIEGKLTEEWRKVNPDVEPADKLLKRILIERRRKWEETELAKMKATGKEPKDDKWKKKYQDSPQIDESLLPALPNGWEWSNLPQIGEINRGKSKHRPRNAPFLYGGPYPFVQTGDVRHSTNIIKHYSQTYSEEGLKQSRLWPKDTLCITIAANIADTAILGFDACFPDSIVGFIPENKNINVKFVEYFIRTAKEDLERYAPATAQKNINLGILSRVAVPLPPKEEQYAIVDALEKTLSVAERIEVSVEKGMRRSDRLRQSILKKAFTGKLVPQINDNESPANSQKQSD